MNKIFIVANWKMNPSTIQEAKFLFDSVLEGIEEIKKVEIVVCPPFIYIPLLQEKDNIKLGAQNAFFEQKGAFTGEISSTMLKNLGCSYVIIGHSERRKIQEEINEVIAKKVKAVLEAGLKPILCIEDVSQLKYSLGDITEEELNNLILAYEPVFAIGTGKPCSIEKAKEMREMIEKELHKSIPILYGGSVNSTNAQPYIKEAGFQGLLIGGASLNSLEFLKIVKSISD